MEFERRTRRHHHIDVAPLVDVVFNLLLFFVITYNVTADPAIRIKLPDSITADTRAEELVIITVTKESIIYVGEQVTALEDIGPVVKEKLASGLEASVKIKTDQEAPVGLLVKVVDGVRLSGCNAFSIVTERQ